MLPNDHVRTLYDVLRLPDVRRIELGWGVSVIGELAGQVTLVVYALDAGGAVLVATYVASRTLLSMAVMVGITAVSGRAQPGLLLRRVTWLRAALLALAALTAALHGGPAAVIGLAAASSHEFPAGTVAVREGEAGELFHLIVAGSAAVSVRGKPRPPLAPGDCFGEIALLRGIPRTATVVADQPLRTLALDREAFLLAVTGNSTSSAAADALVTQRLTADSLIDPDTSGTR